MLKCKLTLVLLLAVTYLSAQTFLPREGFFPGTLFFTNGKTKTGYVAAPKHPNDKNVLLKTNEKAKAEKVPGANLDSLTMTTDDGKVITFENLPWTHSKNGKVKDKEWFFLVVKGYASLYLFTDVYLVTKTGNAYAVNRGNGNMGAVFSYYIRKKGDKVSHHFAESSEQFGVVGLGTILKKAAADYLSEDADLVDKINKKQLTHKDMEEIIHIYNDFMAKKE